MPPTPPHRAPGLLVVDDDAGVRAMLSAALLREGFTVWLAADGREALAVYGCHRDEIDVLLIDVRMPGLDGPATLAALREIDPHLRVAFMSGGTGRYGVEDLLAAGAARVFQKPFNLGDLARGLRDLAGGQLPASEAPAVRSLRGGHRATAESEIR